MKDHRHLHPLNDPEHQRTCLRCRAMDVIGEEVQAAHARVTERLGVELGNEPWFTFLIGMAASLHSGLEPNPALTKEMFLREAGAIFDAALVGESEN